MDTMKEIEKHRERKERGKKRKAEQRKNNKHLAKAIAKELKSSTPTSDDSRIATIEKRLTELENLVHTFLARDEVEDLQESSIPVHDTADTTQTEQEGSMKLKKQKYKGEIINLRIEAVHHKSRNSVWYKVTGGEIDEYTGLSTYVFAPYNMDRQRPEESVALEDGPEHEECVQLLYNAGIITGEKTGSYTSSLYPFDSSCTYYRLTDQDIEHANRRQKITPIQGTVDNAQAEQEEAYPGLRLKGHEWRGREINLYIEAKQPYPNENPWYDITGYYTCGGEEVQLSQYTFDFYRYRDSAAIDMWEDHDKIVRLLYNAGIITKEKTYTSIGLEKKCICYRLTDQALAYAHREQ